MRYSDFFYFEDTNKSFMSTPITCIISMVLLYKVIRTLSHLPAKSDGLSDCFESYWQFYIN